MALTINGRTLAQLGMVPRQLDGWLDGPNIDQTTLQPPDLTGVVPAPVSTTPLRLITVVATVACSAITDRPAKIATIRSALSGRLHVRSDDATDRFFRATASGLTVASVAPGISMAANAASLVVSFSLRAHDAASYDVEPRVLVLSSTPVQVAMGTLPSPGIIYWSGAWSETVSRTLTYRGVNGIAYGTMVLTPPAGESLSSSEFIEVDVGRRYITKVTNTGVRSNVYHWLSSGAWFVPDAIDSDNESGRGPTLDISAGVGTFVYRKAWAL